MGQGRENVRQFLRDNPDIFAQMRAKVLEIKRPKPPVEAAKTAKPAPDGEEKKTEKTVAAPTRKPIAAASRKR